MDRDTVSSGNRGELPAIATGAKVGISWVAQLLPVCTRTGRVQIIRAGFEDRPKPPNDGVKLIAAALSLDKALEERIPLMIQLEKAQNDGGDVDTAQRTLEIHDEHIEAMQQEIRDAQYTLWGLRPDLADAEVQPDD